MEKEQDKEHPLVRTAKRVVIDRRQRLVEIEEKMKSLEDERVAFQSEINHLRELINRSQTARRESALDELFKVLGYADREMREE